MSDSDNTATIRELRTDFRAVKRRIEKYGQVVITDHGQPAYIIKRVSEKLRKKKSPLPDYYPRLLKRQPTELPADATDQFWDEERMSANEGYVDWQNPTPDHPLS